MKVKQRVEQIVREKMAGVAEFGDDIHFYNDIGLDSLKFIELILMVEKEFQISISITEMHSCLRLNRLVALVETKLSPKE